MADISIQQNSQSNPRRLHGLSKTPDIACCLCGTLTAPNPAYQCAPCLATQFDLQPILAAKVGDVHQCRRCLRFEAGANNNRWAPYEFESHGLMGLCLKKVHALQSSHNVLQSDAMGAAGSGNVGKIKLVDASWVWTEPHSMRLKVRLTVQANVLDDTITIRQRAVVEFKIRWLQCPECNKNFNNQQYHAIVQVRQKRKNISDGVPKGLLMLEMALAKSKTARRHILDMKTMQNGFDFYFSRLDKAQSFAAFISKVAPMRIKASSKLVSSDNHNNTANIKTTVICDLIPLGRDDLIICDKKARDGAAGRLCGRLAIVYKMSSVVHLVDASPKRDVQSFEDISSDLFPEKYWRAENFYRILLPPKRMVRFIVLDVERCDGNDDAGLYEGSNSSPDVMKYALADVEVVKEADFGVNDVTYRCTTHLGNLLSVGDYCLGYDLTSSTSEEVHDLTSLNKGYEMPDIVLVKKIQVKQEKEDTTADINNNSNDDGVRKNKKVRSSKAKRREKRRMREEAKENAYQDTLKRMGFKEEKEEIIDSNNISKARAQFEEELKNDPALEEELKIAEEALDSLTINDDDVDECNDLNGEVQP